MLQVHGLFFATSHGKGAVDGIGVTTKRAVARAILSRRFNVQSALDFAECAKKVLHNIDTIYIPKEDIEKLKPLLDERWKNVSCIPQTRKVHHVTSVSHRILKTDYFNQHIY